MAKTVEYYISKGFDKKMAEYFSSGRKKVVSVKANADFSLTLEFDNGEKRLYDVRPLIQKGTVFEKSLALMYSKVYTSMTVIQFLGI